MIQDALYRVASCRESLSRADAHAVMADILAGKCSQSQVAGLLVALHMKGETVEEIVGFAEAMREAATPLNMAGGSMLDVRGHGRVALVDTCGTGGAWSGTVKLCTDKVVGVAGTGVRVAKQGDR